MKLQVSHLNLKYFFLINAHLHILFMFSEAKSTTMLIQKSCKNSSRFSEKTLNSGLQTANIDQFSLLFFSQFEVSP